jgi:hypothetical protein
MRALKIETGSLFRMDMDDLDASDIHNGSGIPEGYDTLDTPGTPRTTDSSKVPNVPDILRTPHKREASGTPDADVRKVPNLGDVSDNLDPGEASDTPNALKARDTSKVPDAPDVTHAPNLPKVPDAPDVTHTPNVPKTPNTPDALEAPDSHDMSPGRHDSVVNAGASIDWVKSEALPGDINDTSTAVGEVRTISGKASTGVKVEQVGVEDSGIRDSGYRSESRDGSDDVEALTDRRLLCGCLLVTTRLQIRSCGREYLHTPWVQTTRIDHLKQLLESLPDALPEGDESYFPSAPRDWNLEEFDKAEGDHGLILEQWFKSAYGDPTNMGKQDVSKEDSDRFAALAAEQGPCAARQVDASVFWARGQRSSELIDALQSAYSWVREHDKETIQLDLILLEFLNCAKNTFRRWNIKVCQTDLNSPYLIH